jgi:Holliday junction resolvasome RuvABC endonuclease subunit
MQVQAMVRALCGLSRAPKLDASDALAVAICHAFRARRSTA